MNLKFLLQKLNTLFTISIYQKGKNNMQFLQLLEAIASNLNATNIDSFISLVEGLVSLGENVIQHNNNSNPPAKS
jgi:hypothetical protein